MHCKEMLTGWMFVSVTNAGIRCELGSLQCHRSDEFHQVYLQGTELRMQRLTSHVHLAGLIRYSYMAMKLIHYILEYLFPLELSLGKLSHEVHAKVILEMLLVLIIPLH